MKFSEVLIFVANANRQNGYEEAAAICEKQAAIFEAEEILEDK